jgi:hypothetical protein
MEIACVPALSLQTPPHQHCQITSPHLHTGEQLLKERPGTVPLTTHTTGLGLLFFKGSGGSTDEKGRGGEVLTSSEMEEFSFQLSG